MADTKPNMAKRPLILSGAGPPNARISENLVLDLGTAGRMVGWTDELDGSGGEIGVVDDGGVSLDRS